jgi:hypothetical protein
MWRAGDGAERMTGPLSVCFHVAIHARPPQAVAGPIVPRTEIELSTLAISPETIGQSFAVSFESASKALARFQRLFIEPDGSFVWVSSADEPKATWQLDGVLYDRGGKLLFVDLKGSCPQSPFDRFLAALGWPATPLVFQLAREAVFLEESEFRKYAWRSTTKGTLSDAGPL